MRENQGWWWHATKRVEKANGRSHEVTYMSPPVKAALDRAAAGGGATVFFCLGRGEGSGCKRIERISVK